MKYIILLIFVGVIASTCGVREVLDNVVGDALNGGDKASVAQSGANGQLAGLTANPVVDLGELLGKDKSECIKLCPVRLASSKTKCIKPTDYPEYPRCYQINPRRKFVWPCTNEKKKEVTNDVVDKN